MEKTKKAATKVIVVDRKSPNQEEFRRIVFETDKGKTKETYFKWTFTAPDGTVNVITRYKIIEPE